jgi:hypothetical protein
MSSVITLPNGNVYTLIPLPAYPGLAQFSMTMLDSVSRNPSPFAPGTSQTQAWPGADNLAFEFTLPKMNRWVSARWKGFMAELRGMQNVFQIGDPSAATPLGVADGTPVCATSGVQNLTSAVQLFTSGWTPNVFGQLLAGDMLQLGYHLHYVCENVNSDAGGNATISIFPSLRDSPANLSAINLINPAGLFRLAQNSRAYHSDFTGLTQMSFKVEEAR